MKLLEKICFAVSSCLSTLSATLIVVVVSLPVSARLEVVPTEEYSPSIFALYADNREQGIPNHITVDLALVSYSLLRQNSIQTLEEKNIVPRFAGFLDALEDALSGQAAAMAALPEGSVNRTALQANIQLVQLLQALMHPDRADQLSDNLKVEYGRVVDAQVAIESTLWGRMLDYTQYKPRGRYTRDEPSQRFFRAFRYVSGQWFAIKASAATGISEEESHVQIAQIVQLVRLVSENEPLLVQRQALENALNWQFGVTEDLRDSDVLDVLENTQTDGDFTALSQALFEYAVKHQRQPSVVDAVVELNLLESDVTLKDVVSGWRLIPSRLSVQMSTQQALLYDNTGDYLGDAAALPFSYGVVNGQGVKSYPTATEWLALISGEGSIRRSHIQSNEARFENYDVAFETSQELLQNLTGVEQLHAEIIRTGIDALEVGLGKLAWPHLDAESLNGFQTWQRFLDVLYTRQSYTASSKGLMLMNPSRNTASLDVATDVYLMLAHAARMQWQQTGLVEWQAFAEILDRLVGLSSQASYGGKLSPPDIAYLNNLDTTLLSLTGGPDSPVVIDVHTNPNENQVVQQATGFARIVQGVSASPEQTGRGARLSFHEFKQAVSERLTVEQWQALLDTNHAPTSGESDR